MKNEFDNQLLKKFEEHEFPYNDIGWEALRKDLPPIKETKKTFWITAIGVAASLFIAAVTLGWLYMNNTTNQETIVINNTPATHQPPRHATTPANPQTAIAKQDVKSLTPKVFIPKHTQQAHKNILLTKNNITPNIADNNNANPPPTIATASPITNATQTNLQQTPTNTTNATTNTNPIKRPLLVQENEIGLVPSIHTNDKNNKPNLSLAGGLNYGSLNTGYTAGLNAHQKIGRKLFIEGDLAVTNNRSNNVSVISASQFSAFSNGAGASKPITNAVQQSTASFLYLQFNPSVGYNVHPKIALSFGADLQKLLNNNNDNRTVIFNADEPKQLPNFDIGLTGKTEVSVTPRLKAGLLYREGLNNFINGSNEYFDRRYLQVQLKFRVLGK